MRVGRLVLDGDVILPADGATVNERRKIGYGGLIPVARLTGPGKVWIQSLPFARLAGRMLAAAGPGGQNRGEGSVLGGLGDLIGGNN